MEEYSIDKVIEGDVYRIPATTQIYDSKSKTTATHTVIESIPRVKEIEELDRTEEAKDVEIFGRPTYKRIYFYAGMLDLEKCFLKHREPKKLEQCTAELIRDTLDLYKTLTLRDLEMTMRMCGLYTMLVAIRVSGHPAFKDGKVFNNRGERCEYGYATVFADTKRREEEYAGQGISEGDHVTNHERLAKAGHLFVKD
jgi:hypothetical protein